MTRTVRGGRRARQTKPIIFFFFFFFGLGSENIKQFPFLWMGKNRNRDPFFLCSLFRTSYVSGASSRDRGSSIISCQTTPSAATQLQQILEPVPAAPLSQNQCLHQHWDKGRSTCRSRASQLTSSFLTPALASALEVTSAPDLQLSRVISLSNSHTRPGTSARIRISPRTGSSSQPVLALLSELELVWHQIQRENQGQQHTQCQPQRCIQHQHQRWSLPTARASSGTSSWAHSSA